MAKSDYQTFFLVEFEDRVMSWCQIGTDDKTGKDAWINIRGRRIPYEDGKPIHHMAVPNINYLLKVKPLFGDILRKSAEKHLLRPDSDQGWIAPDGIFFGCGFHAHDDLANLLFGCHVGDMEYLGYVRVHESSYQHSPFDRIPLTTQQKRTLKGLGFYMDDSGWPQRIREMDRTPLSKRLVYTPGDEGKLPPLGDLTRIRFDMQAAARAEWAGPEDVEADAEDAPAPGAKL